jgi:hypothetical protein
MLKKAVLAISKSVKSNSAALIIGASIIIGLNLHRFIGATESLWYEISGQADRDQKLKEQTEAYEQKVLQDRTTMSLKIATSVGLSLYLVATADDFLL